MVLDLTLSLSQLENVLVQLVKLEVLLGSLRESQVHLSIGEFIGLLTIK